MDNRKLREELNKQGPKAIKKRVRFAVASRLGGNIEAAERKEAEAGVMQNMLMAKV